MFDNKKRRRTPLENLNISTKYERSGCSDAEYLLRASCDLYSYLPSAQIRSLKVKAAFSSDRGNDTRREDAIGSPTAATRLEPL
jgi:hypothetical protein